ncbi:MAG: hypothetical protein DME26_18245 [Verrucomicrobia bacterium]|nr:MAG: hypothetical protein DME26_18245 [Verrucomicrobiota bacterium]
MRDDVPSIKPGAPISLGIRLIIGGAMTVVPFAVFLVHPRWDWDPSAQALFPLLGMSREAVEALRVPGTVGGSIACGLFVLFPVIKFGRSWHQQVACVLYLLLLMEATFLLIGVPQFLYASAWGAHGR